MVTDPTPLRAPTSADIKSAILRSSSDDVVVMSDAAADTSRTVRFGQLAKAAATRGAWTLFMHIGTPVVALTAPALIERFDGDARNNVPANLVVGSALGGAWGALVGATIPVNFGGERVPRLKGIALGMGSGLVIGPAISGASRVLVDWFLGGEQATAPAGT